MRTGTEHEPKKYNKEYSDLGFTTSWITLNTTARHFSNRRLTNSTSGSRFIASAVDTSSRSGENWILSDLSASNWAKRLQLSTKLLTTKFRICMRLAEAAPCNSVTFLSSKPSNLKRRQKPQQKHVNTSVCVQRELLGVREGIVRCICV